MYYSQQHPGCHLQYIICETARIHFSVGAFLFKEFANSKPVREISLVVTKNFPRKKILENLKEAIASSIPDQMQTKKQSKIISRSIVAGE